MSSCSALPECCARWNGEPEHTWTESVCDLCHHAQHFYCTILSHTANCCGPYKLIWTVSCITANISHPSCCQLTEVLPLSIHHFIINLSVWLLSSCNAAPLIAKATTQLKELSFRQPIIQYQILCCYRVSRPGLLNEQWLRRTVRVDREKLGLSDIPNSWSLKFGNELGIYSHPVFPQLLKCATRFSNGRTKCHWSVDSKTVEIWWADECLEQTYH